MRFGVPDADIRHVWTSFVDRVGDRLPQERRDLYERLLGATRRLTTDWKVLAMRAVRSASVPAIWATRDFSLSPVN
jgi:hypothetical protein